ncbi:MULTISPECIES: hypothetical protein [unclassified Rathayibacter]|uniref:hypothetical protein n=1 Tax=unclassified Rathayibacter TaxID=2609250 RepID=UPI0010EE8BE3|nr:MULTISPECIES: hypothetical protein [unclassified Rathayibacter]TCL79542.1 hypothetical protein EDF49_111178 [Rathayibacter sp. PhB192]TCM25189.1 hypothetical protein EDF43_11117 [Rathayibacter sp. PhB179]
MPADSTPVPPDETNDAVHELLAALREPGAIDPGLADLLSQQLHAFLHQDTSDPAQEL